MKIHMVKKGDSLYAIAQKYNVSLEELLQANPEIANPDVIDVGMKVKIPMPAQPAYEVMHQHKVQQGDTLWKLSKAWGIPLETMIKANPQLKNPNVLLTGETVNIPKIGQAEPGAAGGSMTNPMPGVSGTGTGSWPGKADTSVMPGAGADAGAGQTAGAETAPQGTPAPALPEAPGTGMNPGTGVKPGTGIKPGTDTQPLPQPEPMPMPMPEPTQETTPQTIVSPAETAPAPVLPSLPEVKIEYEHIDLFKSYPIPAVEAVAPVQEQPCPQPYDAGGQLYGYGGYSYGQTMPAELGPQAAVPYPTGYGSTSPAMNAGGFPGYGSGYGLEYGQTYGQAQGQDYGHSYGHGYGFGQDVSPAATSNLSPAATSNLSPAETNASPAGINANLSPAAGTQGLPYPVFPTAEMAKAYALQQMGTNVGGWSGAQPHGYGHGYGEYFPGNTDASPVFSADASPSFVSPEAVSPAPTWPQHGCNPCAGTSMWPSADFFPEAANANLSPYPWINPGVSSNTGPVAADSAGSPASWAPAGSMVYGGSPASAHGYGMHYGTAYGGAPSGVSPYGELPVGKMPSVAGEASGPAPVNAGPGEASPYPGLYPYAYSYPAGTYPTVDSLGLPLAGLGPVEEDCRDEESGEGAAGVSSQKSGPAKKPAAKAKIKSKPAKPKPKARRKQSLPWVNW